MREFYGHFAAAYGTLWLATLLLAFMTRSQIETGSLGLVGFPIACAIYAGVRMRRSRRPMPGMDVKHIAASD